MTEQDSTASEFEHYDLERLLRKDVLGETWRALDRQTGSRVDLRFVPEWADRKSTETFVSQISSLSHSALVPTRGFIANEDRAAVISDSFEGDTIPARRSRRPKRHFEVSEIKPWLRTMVEVIGYLHGQKMAHGALNLSSFIIEGGSLYVSDLAVSRLLRPQASLQGGAVLPLAVMSPQVMGGAPPRETDDIYALAAITYDLLTSTPVFMSGDIAIQVQSAIPQSVQDRRNQLEIPSAPVPQEWQDWLSLALSKEESKRPGLDSLATLLRTGTAFSGGTTQTQQTVTSVPMMPTSTGTSATPPQTATALPSPGAAKKININHIVLGGALLVCVLMGALVYFLRIAPRNEFKRKMDAEFAEVSQFDLKEHANHDAVIDRWQTFESHWKQGVTTIYPIYSSILETAEERRLERENQRKKDLQQAREDADERRRSYVVKVKAEFESLSASVAVLTDRKPEEALKLWDKFLADYDKDFEGAKVVELEDSLSKARTSQQQLKTALTTEATQLAEFIKGTEDAMTQIQQQVADTGLAASYKVAQIETFLARFATAPRTVMADSKVLEMKTQVENLLPALLLTAGTEIPEKPLDIVGLFPDAPYKDFSENGRKNLLKTAQTTLKELTFYSGTPDGSTGKGTHEALIAFQKSKNLVPSAALDIRTITALGMVNIIDDATALVNEASSSPRRSSGSSRKKKQEEEKSFMGKVGDTTKKVTKSIGGLFSGDKK